MIRRLLHRLLRAQLRYITQDIEWTSDDVAATRNFFATSSGRKLILCLQKIAIANNSSAVQSGEVFKCGQAAGFMEIFPYLDNLSGATPQRGESDEDQEPSPLDHLST